MHVKAYNPPPPQNSNETIGVQNAQNPTSTVKEYLVFVTKFNFYSKNKERTVLNNFYMVFSEALN